MNLLIVLSCCGQELLLATVIIALTLILGRHFGYRRQNELKCGEGTEEEQRLLGTQITRSFCLYGHTEENQENP